MRCLIPVSMIRTCRSQIFWHAGRGAVTACALYRMACPGCPSSRFHTVQDACLEYDADEKLLRAELRKAVSPLR